MQYHICKYLLEFFIINNSRTSCGRSKHKHYGASRMSEMTITRVTGEAVAGCIRVLCSTYLNLVAKILMNFQLS